MDKDKYNTTGQLIDFAKKFWCFYMPSLLVLFIIMISIILVLNIQKQIYIESEKYCDSLYGDGNWYLKETTGSGICKNYIGQCWECYPKEVSLLSSHD
jgi:hypothetical protein